MTHEPVASTRALKVLVAEDDDNDFELLRRELTRGGFRVDARRVETAPQMQAALDDGDWDLIISDWTMPAFDAETVMKTVNELALNVPVIIVSGTVGEELAVAALRSGAHDFIPKDRMARLIPAVERELREVQIRRERNELQAHLMVADRLASIGLLAAGVGHEINNPLATLIGNLELLEQQRTGPASELRDVDTLVSHSLDAARRISRIVDDLAMFAVGDRQTTDPEAVADVHRAVDSAIRFATNEIRHRARLVSELTPTPPVGGHEARIAQVVLNLLVNAAHAIRDGDADQNTITVSTSVRDGMVEIAVADTGVGMPASVLEHVFTPFFTTKAAGRGMGLGLSICHRIVSEMDGTLTATSIEGAGSQFKVRLPIATTLAANDGGGTHRAEPAVASRRTTRSTTDRAAPAGPRTVLVVDDEPDLRTLISGALGQQHDVHTVGSAAEALDRLRDGERYDVILCDLMMPGRTGMELHADVLDLDPAQAGRMVFMTGGAFTPAAQEFLDHVDPPLVHKPFAIKDLRAAVSGTP